MQSNFENIDFAVIGLSNTPAFDSKLEDRKKCIVDYWNSFKRIFEEYEDDFVGLLEYNSLSYKNFLMNCKDSFHSDDLEKKLSLIESDFKKIKELFPIGSYETILKFKNEKTNDLYLSRREKDSLRASLQTYCASYSHFDDGHFDSQDYINELKRLSKIEDEQSKKDALSEIDRSSKLFAEQHNRLIDLFAKLNDSKLEALLENNRNLRYKLSGFVPNFVFNMKFDFDPKLFLKELDKYTDKNSIKSAVEKLMPEFSHSCKDIAERLRQLDNPEIQSVITWLEDCKHSIQRLAPNYVFFDGYDFSLEKCKQSVSDYWDNNEFSFVKKRKTVEHLLEQYVKQLNVVQYWESYIVVLDKIMSFMKNKTLTSIDKSFKYLNVNQLKVEYNRTKNWYKSMIISASVFLAIAMCFIGWNVVSISGLNEINDSFWVTMIPKIIVSISSITLMILCLNQASRMRKTLLIISKEINEFNYIEGLLKAKNEVDFDRNSNEAISKVIDKLIENHLAVQKGRIDKEDQTLDSDLSIEGLKKLHETLDNLLSKKK